MIDIHAYNDEHKKKTYIKAMVMPEGTPEDTIKALIDRIKAMVPPTLKREQASNIMPCSTCAKYDYCFYYEECGRDIKSNRALRYFKKKAK